MTGDPPLVVAIDGPAGGGKSTVARGLAEHLGWAFLDTGAMYRLVTLAALAGGVTPDDGEALAVVAQELDAQFLTDGRVLLQGADVTARIRDADVTRHVPRVASWPQVREHVVAWQRALARRAGRMVAEGRDTGTVVFPDAAVKIYLDAAAAVRARRRLDQEGGGGPERLREVLAAIEARDEKDRTREVSPLCQAEDAWRLDTSELTLNEVHAAVRSHVRSRIRIASGDQP